MASLQPESDQPLEKQGDNSNSIQDKHKKEERCVSADGIADYTQDFRPYSESGKEHNSSCSRPSYASEPNINSDPKPNIESCSVTSGVHKPNNTSGPEVGNDSTGTHTSDILPSGAIKPCIKSDSALSASTESTESLKSCTDSDHARIVQREDFKSSEEPATVQPDYSRDLKSATSLNSVHRASTGDESESIHSKLNQNPKSFTKAGPVQTVMSEHQDSESSSTQCKLRNESNVIFQGEKSQPLHGVDSMMTSESSSGLPAKPVNKSVNAKAKCIKGLKHNMESASSLKPKDGLQDENPGLIWSDTDVDSKKRDNGPEPIQRKPKDQATKDITSPKEQEQEKELTDLSMEMECDAESTEIKQVNDGKTLGEEGGEHVKEVEMKDAKGVEDEEHGQTLAVEKPKKSRLKCRDCGKTFPRREAYDLHRHFHMHQDEQASLTCKECGLTFQHRSSLIKHRSEHKQNGIPESVASPRRSQSKELRGYTCDSCGELFASLIRFKLHACQVSLEKPYRCPLCRKDFQYRVSINAHMKSHSLDSPYRCLECNKGFQCAVTLHIHQRSHAALKPYECPDCGMVFRHRSLMDDHRRKHTEERPHQCTICSKSFKYSSLLQQHQYLHTGQKPYHCSECGKTFALAQNMRAHCRQHKKLSSSIFGTKSNNMPNSSDFTMFGKENTNQRNCPLCIQVFCTAADLRAHMLSHEAEYDKKQSLGKINSSVYTCSDRQLQFSDESALESHSLTQVQMLPQKRGALCVASTTSVNNSIEGDWADQSEKKPLKCKDCGKSFHYRSVLELHMRIHNRGYQCNVCKKSFRFSSYLQQHLIIHSGKKPYKCPDCGKDFAFLQNMKTHQRLHQQKPFRCTQCRKGYSDESQLQRHMLCHSGEKPYKCNLCNKSFGLAYLLRDHLNTHTGERPHRCQECHKSFPWLSSLLVHQKIHARKRQVSQSYSSSIGSQRERPSGLGRGRKSWPGMEESVENLTALQQPPFCSEMLQGPVPKPMMQECSGLDLEQAQSMPLQLQQQWQMQIASQLQQKQQSKWLSDGQTNKQQWPAGAHLKLILPKPEGVSKLSSRQQSPGWVDVSQSAQAGTVPKKLSDNLSQDNGDSVSPNISPSKAMSDKVQERLQPASRLSSTSKAPNKAEGHSSLDATMLASLKVSGEKQQGTAELDKINNKTDDQPQEQQSAGHATSVIPLDMSKSSSIQDKPVNEKVIQQPLRQIIHPASQQNQPLQLVLQPSHQIQLLQQAVQQMQPEQLNQITTLQLLQQQQFHQSQSNQLGSVSVQFGAASFAHSNGGTVFGFQPTQVVSQSLLNGPVQQQAPLVSGSQIILNQTSPFISSPLSLTSPLALSATHPIHSIAGQLPGPAPQSVFFTPRSTTQVGHHFRCMICGCILPGDLELQMHYMKHAQGEI